MKASRRQQSRPVRQALGIALLALGLLCLLAILFADPADELHLPAAEVRNPLSLVGVVLSWHLITFGLGRVFSLVFPLIVIQAGWSLLRSRGIDGAWRGWLRQLLLAAAGALTLTLFLAEGPVQGSLGGAWWAGALPVLLSQVLITYTSLLGATILVLAFDAMLAALFFGWNPARIVEALVQGVATLRKTLSDRWRQARKNREARRKEKKKQQKEAEKLQRQREQEARNEAARQEMKRREEAERLAEEQRQAEERQREEDRKALEKITASDLPEEEPLPRERAEEQHEASEQPPAEEAITPPREADNGTGEPDEALEGEPDEVPEFEITEEVIEQEKRFKAEKVREYRYTPPPVDILNSPPEDEYHVTQEDMEVYSRMLESTLKDFNVDARVVHVNPGPVITRYDLEPAAGVKVNRIVSLADDLALALRAERIRIIAPVPGKAAVGVEIPNKKRNTVYMRSIVNTEAFSSLGSPLALALGKTSSGETYVADLRSMPHLLVAGQTGAGKSVCINSIICSILLRAKPTEVQFVLIDPKMIELSDYRRMARHFLAWMPGLEGEVITDPKDAVTVLEACEREMDRRYRYLSETGYRNISEFNDAIREGEFREMSDGSPARPMVYLVIIVDELADLMMQAGKDIEFSIARLAQKARAVGMHLVVATQRPSVDVLTGMIKANFPARIAFAVRQKVDSRTIIDAMGADKLLGKGDMLYLATSTPEPLRIHNCFISGKEIRRIIDHVRKQSLDFEKFCLPAEERIERSFAEEASERDELFFEAAEHVIRSKQGSISVLQRRLRIGHSRASRLIDELEIAGVVGPFDGSKAREVLVDESWLDENRS